MLQIQDDFLAEPITALYNKSLRSWEVTQDWRKAIICPIFKKGDPEDAANYRCVSLTSGLCKIFEKMLKGSAFFTGTRCLSPSQHGFLPRRPRETHLLDEGHAVDLIYVDWILPASMEPCRIGLNLTCQINHTRSKATESFLRRLPVLVTSPKVQSLVHYFFCYI